MKKIFRRDRQIRRNNDFLNERDTHSATVYDNSNCFHNFFKIYFDFAYFFCLSPFRISPKGPGDSFQSSRKVFVKHSWWPQRVACVILMLLGCLWILRDIRSSVPKDSSENPSVHMQMMLTFVGSLYKCVTVFKFWTCHGIVLKIANNLLLESDSSLLENSWRVMATPSRPRAISVITSKPFVVMLCVLYTLNAVVDLISGSTLETTPSSLHSVSEYDSNDKFYMWWCDMVKAGKFNLFMDTNIARSLVTETSVENGTTVEDYLDNINIIKDMVVGISAALGFFQRYLLTAYADFLLLASVLTLWTMSRRLSAYIHNDLEYNSKQNRGQTCDSIMTCTESSNNSQVIIQLRDTTGDADDNNLEIKNESWIEILRQFNTLKWTSQNVNAAFGSNVTCFLVEAVLFYALSFDEIIVQLTGQGNPNWMKVVHVVFYFCNACVILRYSADICFQTTSIKDWLAVDENRRAVPVKQLTFVLNEVDTNVVALSGNKVFPINYSTLASIISLTLTYFIICVQDP